MDDGKDEPRRSAEAFLSYAHYDDKFLRGAIQHMREDLEDAIKFVTGQDFRIFLDMDGIEFGQHWPTQLSDQLKAARFLIPILSPNYFQSNACQQEALEFIQYEAEVGRNDLILPIYLVDTPFVDDPKGKHSNELAAKISERQYRDYRNLVFEERTSAKRSQFIKELASDIGIAVNRVIIEKNDKSIDKKKSRNDDYSRHMAAIEEAVSQSFVHISLSRRRVTVGSNIVDTMRHFWHFLERMYGAAKEDKPQDRLFIWVIDVGSRLAEQPFAFDEYFNAGLLALQLQSFARFDSINDYEQADRSRLFPRLHTAHPVHRNRRWQWLSERSVIVVQNLRPEEYDDLRSDLSNSPGSTWLKDIGVSAEHILPSTTPANWAKQMQELYGRNIDAADATFTVSFIKKGKISQEKNSESQLRYFAHTGAVAEQEKEESPERLTDFGGTVLSTELTSPGRNYDDAFRLLHLAACNRLQFTDGAEPEERQAALAYIEKIGFRVLTLPDFFRSFSRVFEFNDNSSI